MNALRIYDPHECDANGVPLDWERCRACGGAGRLPTGYAPPNDRFEARELRDLSICSICDGHGSLKAAALYARWKHVTWDGRGVCVDGPSCAAHRARCEDCGHPMSEGTWEGEGVTPEQAFGVMRRAIAAGIGIEGVASLKPVYYSPCDEGCDHGGPGRFRGDPGPWSMTDDLNKRQGWSKQASWRQVDVRTLGWPHDLRSEKLAILCLRCWAERIKHESAHH